MVDDAPHGWGECDYVTRSFSSDVRMSIPFVRRPGAVLPRSP